MIIKYCVQKVESCGGNLDVIACVEFDNVEEAIDFHKKQESGFWSWWRIIVEYEEL